MITTNEEEFDRQLTRIGDLYEIGKDEVNAIKFDKTLTDKQVNRRLDLIYSAIEELRNIACMGLKSKYQTGDN